MEPKAGLQESQTDLLIAISPVTGKWQLQCL